MQEDNEEQEEKQEEQEQKEVQKEHDKKQNDQEMQKEQEEQKVETDEIIQCATLDMKDTLKRDDTIEDVHEFKIKHVNEESTLITRKRGRPKKTTSDITVVAEAANKLRKAPVKVFKVKK